MLSPVAASACGWMTATRRTSGPSIGGSSPSSPLPTSTSYGAAPATRSRVVSAIQASFPGLRCLDGLVHLVRDRLRRLAVGGHGDGGHGAVHRQPLVQQRLH